MPEIQDQFAQFVERWRGYLDCDPAPSNSEHFEEELREFARSVVGVCYKHQCGPCQKDMPISEDDPFLHMGHYGIKWPCRSEGIRRHFAWLEK